MDLGSGRDLDLGIDDLAVGTEGPLEGDIIGGPGKAADEAAVLDIRSRHGNGT